MRYVYGYFLIFVIFLFSIANAEDVQIFNTTAFCWDTGCYIFESKNYQYVNCTLVNQTSTSLEFFNPFLPDGKVVKLITTSDGSKILAFCKNYCYLPKAQGNISIDFVGEFRGNVSVEISILHNSSVYGKDDSLGYAYYIANGKRVSLVFDSGKLKKVSESDKNISMEIVSGSKVHLVFTRNTERFSQRARMVRNKEYLNYGKFTFGYEISRKFLVRMYLLENVKIIGHAILYPGIHKLLVRQVSEKPVIEIKVR